MRALLSEHKQTHAEEDLGLDELRRRAYLGIVQTVLHECGRQKIASVASWISDMLQHNEPLVVFAYHRDVVLGLRERFPGAAVLSGRQNQVAREQAIRDFQAGRTQLLLCSLSVASVGITLMRAANLAFAELTWKAADHLQAEDRIHRIGQHRPVTIWYLTARDTIDEIVLRAIERKRELTGRVNDDSVVREISQVIAQIVDRRRKPRVKTRGPRLPEIIGTRNSNH
jgi:hypothetical protein